MKIEERRKYPRVAVRYNVLCENADDPKQRRIHAAAENASRTGLKIRFAGLLKKGTLLKLKIFKTLGSETISCFGKVAWQKESLILKFNLSGWIF